MSEYSVYKKPYTVVVQEKAGGEVREWVAEVEGYSFSDACHVAATEFSRMRAMELTEQRRADTERYSNAIKDEVGSGLPDPADDSDEEETDEFDDPFVRASPDRGISESGMGTAHPALTQEGIELQRSLAAEAAEKTRLLGSPKKTETSAEVRMARTGTPWGLCDEMPVDADDDDSVHFCAYD